jgi:translation initiation factor 1
MGACGQTLDVSESRRVYSTADGDLRRPASRESRTRVAPPTPNDGVVRVSRETSGRRGKTVTVVRGIPPRELTAVAGDLKRRCGSGGAVKDGVVEIQGDHRPTVVAHLEAQGYIVKLAGG